MLTREELLLALTAGKEFETTYSLPQLEYYATQSYERGFNAA